MRAFLLLFTLCSLLAGCSNDDGHVAAAGGAGNDDDDHPSESGLGTCGLRAHVTGGVDVDFTGRDDVACAALLSSGAGLDVVFSGLGAKGSLELVLDELLEGETGSYPAQVTVTSPERLHWQSAACTALLSEHRLLRSETTSIGEVRHYQVTGAASCSEPLEPFEDPEGASATFDSLAFRTELTWTN